MSRTFSRDGRFSLDATTRDRDSYLSSETSYSWKVCRTSTGQEVAAFSGTWDQADGKDERSGVASVTFSEDGLELLVEHFDGTRERRPLPAETGEERREAKDRAAAWEALWKAPGAASAPLSWESPARLFGREIRLNGSFSEQYPVPGGGVAWGMKVNLVVGEWHVEIPAGPEARECNGLRIAVRTERGAVKTVVALELAPARRSPKGLAREEYERFLRAHEKAIPLPWNRAVVVGGRKVILTWALAGSVQVSIDGQETWLREWRVEQAAGLRVAVRQLEPGSYVLHAAPAEGSRR